MMLCLVSLVFYMSLKNVSYKKKLYNNLLSTDLYRQTFYLHKELFNFSIYGYNYLGRLCTVDLIYLFV